MNKRNFLKTTSLVSLTSLTSLASLSFIQTGLAQAATKNSSPRLLIINSSPRLLIITGAITKTNRGAIDPVLDQLMFKQKLKFDKAYGFDFEALMALPQTHFTTKLEYDLQPHQLSGPLLLDVLQAVGVKWHEGTKILLRAIDGFAVVVTMGDIKKNAYILATHLDKVPMSLGGLGPLWAVFNADAIPELAAKSVNERFGLCPWGLYHIEVLA